MPENVAWSQEWYIYSRLGSAVETIRQKVGIFFHRTAELQALPTKTPPWFVCCPFDLRRCPTAWCASPVPRATDSWSKKPLIPRKEQTPAKIKIATNPTYPPICQLAHLVAPHFATLRYKGAKNTQLGHLGMASLTSAVAELGPVLPRDGRAQYHFTLVQNRRRSAGRPCKC